jgi:hypothetical protein
MWSTPARLGRQCAAAHLNVAATRAGGGSCTAELPYLRTLLENCCGVGGLAWQLTTFRRAHGMAPAGMIRAR